MRYVVPYFIPNIKWGRMTVNAEDEDDALSIVKTIHNSSKRVPRSPLMFVRQNVTFRLTAKQKRQIVYGKPYVA